MSNTPMMRQWAQLKRTMPGCLVLFRLGDFYEAFDDDALTLSSVCDVTLTSRPVAKGERVPMAGVPFHAVDGYIAQLVKHGVKVAIVEQSGGDGGPEKRSRMSGPPGGAISMTAGANSEPLGAGAAAAIAAGRAHGRTDAATPGQGDGRSPSGGLMGREVVRVVTAGTLLEADLLDRRSSNYLAAVVLGAQGAGLAYADISTGEFLATQLAPPNEGALLLDELVRIKPAELVLASPLAELLVALGLDEAGWSALELSAAIDVFGRWHFDPANAARVLKEHFGVASLEAFGCADLPLATAAAGALLDYVREAQRGRPLSLAGLAVYAAGGYLMLSAATRRNLELTSSLRRDGSGRASGRPTLLGVIDATVTPMGGRMLRHWLDQPLVAAERIEERLDAVESLVTAAPRRADLRAEMHGLADIERLINRAVSGYAGPRELFNLADALSRLPRLVGAIPAQPPALLRSLFAERHLACAGTVVGLIHAAVSAEAGMTLGASGVIRRGYSPELDAIHESVADARQWIAGLEASERERTGLKKLKVGYNKVFGYYLEVSRAAAGQVPADYQRKQTLVDGERYITPELKAYEERLLGAEERILDLERRLFASLMGQVVAEREAILALARDVGLLDTIAALAEVAVRDQWVRPQIHLGRRISIQAGRHPVIERLRPDQPFVPNDMVLDDGEIAILTGPNMAGKSTVGRQLAQIVVLAQLGSFVPATAAEIGLVDRIFTRIGAQDDLVAGQSTFMVEMIETAHILRHATPQSLVILDELGRGTSTYDGMAIAWAVLEYLHEQPTLGPRTVFATHYHELTRLADVLAKVKNLNMAVADSPHGIVFLHRVEAGAADRSYGIHVAELAGMPRPVVERAWQLLGQLEAQGAAPLQAARRPAGAFGEGQLPLFTPVTPEHPVLAELRALDTDRLTPLQALERLADLARAARDR